MQQDSPGENMGPHQASDQVHRSPLDSSITLEKIRSTYESGEHEEAQELIQQARCQECSAGYPLIDGVDLLCLAVEQEDYESVRYLLKEAHISVPTDPTNNHPALVAAHHGHVGLVRLLLDSLPQSYVSKKEQLLRPLLTEACKKGHLDLVKMLVELYNVDVNDSDIYTQEFPQITELPLYAAATAGNMEIARYLLQNRAGLSSYVLIDHPIFSRQLLRQRVSGSPHEDGDQSVCVRWSGLQLPWLELSWFMDLSSRITHLELSSNQLTSLPSVVPWGLVHLQSLDLQDNLLHELPLVLSSHEVLCTSLKEVNVSQNKLTFLPSGLLHLRHLQRLWASNNHLSVLFQLDNDMNWIGLKRLEELDVSENYLNSLPANIMHCLKSLRSLNASDNRLKELTEPWGCPLKQCRASGNLLESLPEVISAQWRKHLQEVDLCNNKLTELPGYLFELEALVCLRLGGNQLTSLPTTIEWKCTQLRTLDLSHNQLGKSDDVPKSRRLGFLSTWTRRESETVPSVNFPAMLRDCLEVLHLNNNQLEAVPPSVSNLISLTELYLSNNPGLKELPVELGQLSNLWQLDIENLNITSVPLNVLREGTLSVMAFLRAHLRKAEPCRMLKLVVIGPPRQGKTTLLEALQNGRTSQQPSAPSGIDTWSWHLERPSAGKGNKDYVDFNVWDLGGKASLSTVNHCFFTNKALYLVVWNLALGEEAVSSLQTWLLSIEARAPNSAVVVVGTHLDMIDAQFRTERMATLRAYVLALSRSPSGARAMGFPDITCKNIHEVSCKTLEGVDDLKKLLFNVAVSMKDISSPIPQSYLKLQEVVIYEKVRRRAEGQVLYLTDAKWRTWFSSAQTATWKAMRTSQLVPVAPPAASQTSLDIHYLQQVSTNTLQRLFKMSFVPAGFWERFIARMLISLTEMDLQSFEPKRNSPKPSSRSSVMYSFAGALQRSRCSTFRVRRRQTVYWKEGLLVAFHGGHLSVESAEVDWKRKKSGGIRITCQSDTRDFSAMAFITDHVNSLIEQWFPALTGTESDGSLLMEQYQQEQGHYFSMEDCVLAAVDSESIVCPQHPDRPVLLQELVPEFFMTDFPSRLFLQTPDLEYSEEESGILGQGGSGTTIYRAHYCSQPVALKMFSFRKFGQEHRSNTDTMLRHLQSADACRSFSEFRQEASMLRALNHPCIVSLVGISIHPLCFALQLAPLGSLNTVLEESSKRAGVKFIPLGHMLTFKMSYQIVAGLAYLHRKNIIFCDLKSDNILVWSLERPMAVQCVQEMREPSFPCLKYVLSCGAHTQLYLSPLQGPSAVFWDGAKDERNYSVVNVDTGRVEVKRMMCPGTQLAATQNGQLPVDGHPGAGGCHLQLKDMCPLSQPQKHFSSPAVITCFLGVQPSQQNLGRVFAGMSDGLVAVYSLLNDLPLDGETYLCSHSINKALGVDESDLRQKAYPVISMVLLGSDKELWYSNGPGILVIDCVRLQPIRRLEAYTPPSSIVSMTTSFCLWGQEAVWVLDDLTNTVLLYDAASYQLCAKYCCVDRNPLRDVFLVHHPTCVPINDPDDTNDPNDPRGFSPSTPSSSKTSPQGSISPFTTVPSLNGSFSPSQESSNRSRSPQSVKMDFSGFEHQAIAVLSVRESLWIPRCGGDVLVLELQPGPQQQGSKQLSGHVTAVLRPPEGAAPGRLQVASVLDQDTVLCAHRDSLSQWTLCVWRAWGSHQLQLFYSGWENLAHLENSLRRKRER
ncbi:hypothetical protein WMY93_006892 [Mugilogobius chulae]|uniref:Non-specific serine/threonine protein kinase n=1 Tax=Mugilogobius chulae TaxID=88201 RepID=A0AAW0PUP9_9GOBI